MFKVLQFYIFLFILLGSIQTVQAQQGKRIKYQTTAEDGYSSFSRLNGKRIRTLVNGVVFTQGSTTVYCDSTLFYEEDNIMEAYGNVRIVDDSVTITSKRLIYKGDDRTAELRDNVVYTRGERRLFTDFLNYNLDQEIAHYFNNGRLVDNTNRLTSEIGYFYAQQNYAEFFNNAVLVAPDYTLETDTLNYNTTTKIARTTGPTEITNKDGQTIQAKGSEFRTVSDQSEFLDGTVSTEDYELDGDELFFDDFQQYYKANGNVVLTAKENDVIIVGNEGYYDREAGISKIYGEALMKRILKQDTFYLSADTLVAIESDYDSAKRILAYHNVKMYKEGLQGIADSMAYFRADSLIFFYNDPVIWNTDNQITADTINLEVRENEIKKMNLQRNAFMISEDTINNHNQMKGREMQAYFIDNYITQIDVNGNGEILYYALEKGDSLLMGMNKIFCASMKIYFKDQEITNFRVFNKPEAKMIPPHELTAELQRLEGFNWRINDRPLLYDLAPYLHPQYDPVTKNLPDSLYKSTKPKGQPKVFEWKGKKPTVKNNSQQTNRQSGQPIRGGQNETDPSPSGILGGSNEGGTRSGLRKADDQ